MVVRLAGLSDLDALSPLFDAYRQFYRLESDPGGARRFLRDRFERGQSVVFLAIDGGVPSGFTQLYPSFSSASMAPIYILNDLFVAPKARKRGIGAALLRAAAEHGRRAGAVRLTLSTEISNTAAQAVYERHGWKRDTVFCVYNLAL